MTKNPILDELQAVREQLLADAGGTLADWNPTLVHTWTIATVEVGSFDLTVLEALRVDPTAFALVNDPAGGMFALSGSPDGTQLLLSFTPGVASMVPEPGALPLAVVGLVVAGVIVVMRRRSRRYV